MPPACAERRRLRREHLGSSCEWPNISQVLLSVLSLRPQTCPPGFLRSQFQIGNPLSLSPSRLPSLRYLRNGCRAARFRLLRKEIDGHPASNLADATNQLGSFGGGDDAARVQQIE